MRVDSAVAIIVGLCGTVLFTALLLNGRISDAVFGALLVPLALLCLAIHGFSRLKEIDLRSLRLVLAEAKRVQHDLEQIYGGIEHLRREPFVLDEEKQRELGMGGGIAFGSATMRYPAGCIKRERERLARIFVNEGTPEEIATAILDSSLDEKVFKWNGPEVPLDEPPKSVNQREEDKEARDSKNETQRHR